MADLPKPTKPIAWGCLSLFGLPFLAVGVVTATQALRHAGRPTPDWSQVAFGAVFLLAGLGLVLGGPIGFLVARRARGRRAEAPDQPWRWREDWASGRIPGAFSAGGGSFWIIGLIWLAFSVPMSGWLFIDSGAPIFFQGIFGVGFPLVGVVVLVGGLRGTLRRRRFGRSILTLDATPAPPGGALSGRIDCGVEDQLDPSFEVVLQCMETWTEPGTGKSSSRTRTELRWRDDYLCLGERSSDLPDGTLVPVRFDLPADALPSGQGGRGTIAWTLNVSSSLPGIDYRDSFAVPVFAMPEGATRPAPRARPAPPPTARLATGRLRIAEDGAETRVVYPPAMNPGLAAIPTALLAVAGYMTVAYWRHDEWYGYVPAGLFSAAMLWAATRAWLVSTTVIARRGEIQVQRSLLGIVNWGKTWSAGEAEDVELSSDMKTNGTPWHKVVVRSGAKFKRPLGSLIESHGIAERAKDALHRRFKGEG
jgi:hypothetical protein